MEKRCKLCRAEGQKLFLKGPRCFSDKCSISRRQSTPGQHGQLRKKSSEYGIQLRAKQKTKRYYGVREKQFRKYYNMALKIKEGKTGENMLSFLERRLDNVVYRLGWAVSREQAKQFTIHRSFCVNGHPVDISSYLVGPGDVVSVSDQGKKKGILKSVIADNSSKNLPKWLEFSNPEHIEAKVSAIPRREDIDLEVSETLIVELYSK